MMKNKFTLATLGVAVVLGSYMYFVEAKQQAPTDSTDIQVWSLDDNQAKAAGLNSLDVKSGANEAVYKLDGATWRLSSEPKRDLQDSDWNSSYNNIKTLMATRKLETNAKDLAKYGLAKPSVSLHWGDAKAGYGLEVGDKNPIGDAYFVHCDKDDTVYTIASWKVDGWTALASKPPLVPLPSPTPKATPSPKPSPLAKAAVPVKASVKK